jgi:hypothetical protein
MSFPVDHPLLQQAREVLKDNGYLVSSRLLDGLSEPVLLAESPFALAAILAGDEWRNTSALVEGVQVALANWASDVDRSSRRWDLYVIVLLEQPPRTSEEGASIERIEADTNLARKVVRSGVGSQEHVRAALRPLLPLVPMARAALPNLAEALEERLGVHGVKPELARRAISGFLQTGQVRI